MPTMQTHIELSKKRTGMDFTGLHEWLDSPVLSQKDKLSRHNILRLRRNLMVVARLFENDGVAEYLHHIEEDYHSNLVIRVFIALMFAGCSIHYVIHSER